MAEKIKPTYEELTKADYEKRINTPAKNPDYYQRFHQPIIEEAKRGAEDGGKIKVLDVASGHGHELQFIKDDSDLTIYGLDIAHAPLKSAKESLEIIHPIVGDVKDSPIRENSMDTAIALNAVVYSPDKMLETIHAALKPGGKCAVNFRIYDKNPAFYEYYENDGGKVYDQELVVKKGGEEKRFTLKVMDYNECGDKKIRNLDKQVYFQSKDDIEELIKFIGFNIDRHEPFEFESVANPKNDLDVYILEKP